MSFWGRVSIVLAVTVTGTATGALPAKADTYAYAFWLGDCANCTGVVSRDGTPIRLPFGVYAGGIVNGAQAVLDTSGLDGAKVTVVGVSGPCTGSVPVFTCDFGTVGSGEHRAWVILKAANLNTSPGSPAGSVKVTTGTTPASGGPKSVDGAVRMSFESSATDISIVTTATPARIGEVATATYSVRNNGPAVEPYVWVRGIGTQSGTSFVDSDGCTVVSGQVDCRVNNLAVDAVVTFHLRFQVNGCPRVYESTGPVSVEYAIDDPNGLNNNATSFRIVVAGCPNGSSGGSSGKGAPPPSPSASPAASPSASTPASPSPIVASSSSSAPAPAPARFNPVSQWLYGSALAGLAVVVAAGLVLRWRRYRGY